MSIGVLRPDLDDRAHGVPAYLDSLAVAALKAVVLRPIVKLLRQFLLGEQLLNGDLHGQTRPSVGEPGNVCAVESVLLQQFLEVPGLEHLPQVLGEGVTLLPGNHTADMLSPLCHGAHVVNSVGSKLPRW